MIEGSVQFRADESDRIIIILLYNAVGRPKVATVMYGETLGRFDRRDGQNPDTLCQFL